MYVYVCICLCMYVCMYVSVVLIYRVQPGYMVLVSILILKDPDSPFYLMCYNQNHRYIFYE
jgi:hypothetical protein